MKNPEKKEMRRLSRGELLDIIYEMKKNEIELQSRLDEALEKLEIREIQIEEAGSIADASLALNEVFASAQKAADDYVESVKARCELKIKIAEEKAEQIYKETMEKCRCLREAAEKSTSEDSDKTCEKAEVYGTADQLQAEITGDTNEG